MLMARGGTWKAEPAEPGKESEPGLVLYRFEAPLFFANADYFAARVRAVVQSAPHPVQWIVLDLSSVDDIDYTGGLTLATTIKDLQKQGITVALAGQKNVTPDLARLGILDHVSREHMFDSPQDAVAAYRNKDGGALPSHL